MNKQNDNFEAFDILSQDLRRLEELTPEEEAVIASQSKVKPEEEPELVEEDEEVIPEETVEDDVEESTEVDDDVDETKVSTTENLEEYEADIAKYVTDKLEAKLGINLGSFEKIEDIVDELDRMVDESKQGLFANEEIEQLNDFVKNGGDLKKFYGEMYSSEVDLDHIDMESISDQRKVVKENLKNRGYSDKEIDRKIKRYEDSGVLQEEAEDSIDPIKEYREARKKELLVTQQKQAEDIRKRNEKLVTDVQSVIKEMKDVRGISISEKEKKDLFNYILVPDSDGRTKFQKDTMGNAKNIVEAAFFAMKGDALIERAQSKGATNTAKTLKDKLSQKGNRVKKTGTRDSGSQDGFAAFSSMLRK